MSGIGSAFRVALLRLRGVRVGSDVNIGRNALIGPGVVIHDNARIAEGVVLNGNVRIGARSSIQKFVEISGNIEIGPETTVGAYSFLSTMPSATMRIGKDVLVNAYTIIGASERVTIDDHCIFAAYVQITDASHGIQDPVELTKHAEFDHAPVHIHRNVWLGSGAMVTMGVEIGEGCVVGAKALVTRSLPRMSVAYGIPARVVRTRDVEEAVEAR
jgi:acetyltransferase-like isoleucine patch superfamily enzyme